MVKSFDVVIRVLVTDDTRLHTQLLADALRRDGDLEVITSDSQNLISRTDLHNIDVLLLNADMNEQPGGGLVALRNAYAEHPDLCAIVLLDSSKSESIVEAFGAGARGVLSRGDSIETLRKCIRCVHSGQIWATNEQIALLVKSFAASHNPAAMAVLSAAQLSKREVEVVSRVAQGLTNREIAKSLDLSEHTVKNYLFKVYDKLGVSSRVELLFMTMNRATDSRDSVAVNSAAQGIQSSSVLIGHQRAAEQGVPTAQIELARYYWTRKSDSKDLIQAYKWYLIANQHIARACKSVGKELTMDQLLQAEQMAAEWLRKTARVPPTPIRKTTAHPGNGGLRAAGE